MKKIMRLIQKGLLGGILILYAGNAMAQETETFVQMGHSSTIRSIIFSPDGRYVVSGSADNTVKLWEVATGRELRAFFGHSSAVYTVSFSPDGQYIASGSADNTVKLWEVSTGREIRTFSGHRNHVKSVAFSPDGQYIASGSGYSTLKLWEVSTGREIRTFEVHEEEPYVRVMSVAFSPDGRYIASGSSDNIVKLWEVSTGREIRSFSGHGPAGYTGVNTVSFSPDGQYLLSGNHDKTMRLWEVSTGRKLRTFSGHSGPIRSVSFSPDGKQVLSGGEDKTTRLWDVATGRELRIFNSGWVYSVAFSPDGRYVISDKYDTMILWELATGYEVDTFTGHTVTVNHAAYSPDGRHVVSMVKSKLLKLWDVSTGRGTHLFSGHNDHIWSLDYSPDSRFVLSGSEDNTMKLWEASTGREIRSFSGHVDGVTSVAFSPDGKQVLSGGADKTLKLWDIATGAEIRTFTGLPYPVKPRGVAFSPDGRYVIAISSIAHAIKFWEVATGRELHTISGHSKYITSIAFSPDGQRVLSGGKDKTMKLWDATTGREIRTFSGHSGSVSSVAFSPDGRRVLSGGDKTLKLWDAKTGREIRTFSGHSGYVNSVAFSPDGRQVLSSSNDRTIRIWDADTGKELAKMVSFLSNEWVIITPEGYYNASKNGADFLNVRIGNEVFSMDNFFDTYYRPDIVRAKLAGEDISPLADSDIRNVTALPPSVRFITPEDNTTSNAQQLTLSTEITDRGGGIDEVRLFHNGKVISTETRGLKVVKDESTMNPEFEVNLLTGENTFRLIAFSEGDRIESNPATLTVNYEGATSKTRLFTLVIGINEYKNPKYSLNYARSDAAGFEERITQGGASIFDTVVQTTITDAEATKQNIFAALEEIKSEAGPEDMFVFYYAGHGVMSDPVGGSSEFYMAPYGVTQLYGNPALLQSHGIAASEIQEYSKNIRAQKQLFVLDACQSGGATEMLAMRGAAEEKAIAQLARSTGTFWLTASGSEQFATEFAALGHGVFTYAILEGLSGSADQGAGDGKITVQELSAFLNDRVPELTQIHKGQAQYPSSYGYGQDFPIGVIKK